MKKNSVIAFFIVIYGITLGIRVYWLTQKDGFNVDEGLSVTLACYNDYMSKSNYELDRLYTGNEVKEISLCDNDSIKNVLGDVSRLWKDNRDSPHTNFYYSLLRISLAGLKTGDTYKIIFRGGLLNCILFTISFCFFYAMLGLLFQDNMVLKAVSLFCTFMSTAAISNTLLLRPYQLQETLFIVFCYFFIKSIGWKKYMLHDNNMYIHVKSVFVPVFVVSLTLLTGYYSVIFIGFFGLYILYTNYRIKNHRETLVYILILILGIVFAQIFYLRYILGFIGYRATETAQTLFDNFGENLKSSFLTIVHLLNTYYFTWPVMAVCLTSLLWAKIGKNPIAVRKYSVLIFFAAMAYLIIVICLAPYKMLRYVMPVFPFFILLPATLIESIGNKKVSFGLSLLLCICFSFYSVNMRYIENVYKDKPNAYLFSQDREIPVFVINKESWKYADLVPYFNNDQEYYFIDRFENNITKGRRALYLITESSGEIPDTGLSEFEIESEYSVSYFICRKLIRKND